MLETRKELKERIDAQTKRISELESEFAEAETKNAEQIVELEESNASYALQVAELTDKLAESEKRANEAEAINIKLEEKNAELEKSLEDDAERVTEAAVKELASVGHEPVDQTKDDASALTPEAIRERFSAMKAGDERSKFYQEHRDVLAK